MTIYIIAFAIFTILLLACQVYISRRHFFAYKKLESLLSMAQITGFSSLVLIVSTNKLQSTICQGIFYCSIDWLLFLMIVFINEYCEFIFFKFINKWVIAVLAILDNISIVVSMFAGNLYKMVESEYGGEIHYVGQITPFFHIHLGFSYLLVAVVAFMLITKIVYTPKFYKKKYIYIITCFIVIVVLDALNTIFKPAFDMSAIGFPIASLLVAYFSAIHSPKELLNSYIGMTTEIMQQGLLITDEKYQMVYLNDTMDALIENVFNIETNHENKVAYKQLFEAWCKEHFRNPEEDFVCDITAKQEKDCKPENVYYTLSYKRVLDEKGKLISTYIVVADKTESVLKLQAERHMATHDRLTGIYNAERFYEQCENTFKLHNNKRYVMVVSNIQNFKLVNEIFGKEAADQMLIDIADKLRECALPGDIFARIGDDKFAFLMPKKNFREMVFISISTDTVKVKNAGGYPFPCYMGVYDVTDTTVPVREMCKKALAAQETIKGDPGKRIAYYTEELAEADAKHQELDEMLSSAIENGEIEPYYQPFYAPNGMLLGAEALARWHHPTRGLLYPADFVPFFEKNSRIGELDRHIWECGCKMLKQWNDMGFDRAISFNISTKDFFFTDLYGEFMALVEKYELNPHKIFLEIVEESLDFDFEKQSKLIERLRRAGFTILVDRYMNNGSLVGYMRKLEVDGIKLDYSQVTSGELSERSTKILYKAVEMANAVNIIMGASYVKTKEEEERLRAAGCMCFQGELYGEAVSGLEFDKKYN